MDIFANIAAHGITFQEGLVSYGPREYKEINLTLSDNNTKLFEYKKAMNTAESLKKELEKYKNKFTPFLNNYAPIMNEVKFQEEVKTALWRIETEEDRNDFSLVLDNKGSWEKINLPHFGAPLGRNTTYYRFTKIFDKKVYSLDEIYLCFNGVDYVTKVYLNNRIIVQHEGLFGEFEARLTPYLKDGENVFVIEVQNDLPMLSGGDKIYAASGPGFDDPEIGWHNCPSAMGIYQKVYFENRNEISISDVFVRPFKSLDKIEVTIDVNCSKIMNKECYFKYSIYGQNFNETIIENIEYKPGTYLQCGLGDSLTEAERRSNGSLDKKWPLYCMAGLNTYNFEVEIQNAKIWNNETPNLYQIQIQIFDDKGNLLDNEKSQFGMRFFEIDTENTPKGLYYLNNEPIKLRGANTMGHEQQCVLNNDFDQLTEDILLAKICNMNFLRLTQRPVQREIYDYCDKLGLMIQTDLPLFGALRRSQVTECIREAEEMEHLIRSHACCIVSTYINEPFPNSNNQPHRFVDRTNLENFFKAASLVMRMQNPDRVIKPIDGDYNPPEETSIPDNHCYPSWYNGHGIDLGLLHKGYWLSTKPDWYHGCGEYGCEGLDNLNVMKEKYLTKWLPKEQSNQISKWTPNKIPQSQVGKFHYFFFKTPKTLEQWIEYSQVYQAYATELMTRAFRRDPLMSSFAIHLFIDNFPAGWMKTIMDCYRQPKLSYFAYRDSLSPILLDLRCDRLTGYEGEIIQIDCFVMNDKNNSYNSKIEYQILKGDECIKTGSIKYNINSLSVNRAGVINICLPKVTDREIITVQARLITEDSFENYHSIEIETFEYRNTESFVSLMEVNQDTKNMFDYLKIKESDKANSLYIDDFSNYVKHKKEIDELVKQGKTLIISDLPLGKSTVIDEIIETRVCPMLPVHFSEINEDRIMMKEFKENDFRYFCDDNTKIITPLAEKVFLSDSYNTLLGGATSENDNWYKAHIVADLKVGKGLVIINLLKITNNVKSNPIVQRFVNLLIEK